MMNADHLQKFLDENLSKVDLSIKEKYESTLLIEFGKEVKLKRKKLNYSQKELALACGINQGNISKIEKGLLNITFNQAERIIKALNSKLIIKVE